MPAKKGNGDCKSETHQTCPRCDYQSMLKSDMHRHLFVKKKPCPATANDIELTVEIKEHVMSNRIYKPPEKPKEPHSIIQTINNYNTMINFIAGIDTITKIEEYTKHKGLYITPFDESIAIKYEKERESLQNGKGKHGMTFDEILDFIDEVTTIDKDAIEDFNIFYDKELNNMFTYEGNWKEMTIANGVQHIVEVL